MPESTQPGVVQFEETETDAALDVPWNVIVLNDPINLMNYVTMVFMRVFGYARGKAERHMLEVHSYQLLAHMEKSS